MAKITYDEFAADHSIMIAAFFSMLARYEWFFHRIKTQQYIFCPSAHTFGSRFWLADGPMAAQYGFLTISEDMVLRLIFNGSPSFDRESLALVELDLSKPDANMEVFIQAVDQIIAVDPADSIARYYRGIADQ